MIMLNLKEYCSDNIGFAPCVNKLEFIYYFLPINFLNTKFLQKGGQALFTTISFSIPYTGQKHQYIKILSYSLSC